MNALDENEKEDTFLSLISSYEKSDIYKREKAKIDVSLYIN